MMTLQRNGSYRWTICGLLFFATTINYIDRQVLGYLKPILEKEFQWTEIDYSHIVQAFTAAYAIGLITFGRFIDRIGTKLGYTISITIWSIAAMAHAAVKSTFGFGVARTVLGLGESGNFPAAIKTVAEWFPKKERALAAGILDSGTSVGACVAPILIPWLLGWYGWQEAFIITGALGFIWLVLWQWLYNVPSKSKKLSKAEYDYIHSDTKKETAQGISSEPVLSIEDGDKAKLKWSELFRYRQTWIFIMGKFLTDPIWYFFLFWLPSYFSSTFKMDMRKPSFELFLIYIGATLGAIGGGYLSSLLIKKGWLVYKSRKFTMLLSALCVLPIIATRFTDNMWVVIGLIALAIFGNSAWSANLYTLVSDMLPKKAVSSVIGIGGTAGSIGGVLFPIVVGVVLEHYKGLGNMSAGYNILFTFCGLSFLFAWLVIHWLKPKMDPVEF